MPVKTLVERERSGYYYVDIDFFLFFILFLQRCGSRRKVHLLNSGAKETCLGDMFASSLLALLLEMRGVQGIELREVNGCKGY